MKTHLINLVTPVTWAAALLPDLEAAGAEVAVYPSLGELADAEGDLGTESLVYVVYVDTGNAVEVADWWARRCEKGRLPGLLVVVGTGGLRYEWQFRELGAISVVDSVALVPRVVRLAQRCMRLFPKSDEKWPEWIHAKTAEWSGT